MAALAVPVSGIDETNDGAVELDVSAALLVDVWRRIILGVYFQFSRIIKDCTCLYLRLSREELIGKEIGFSWLKLLRTEYNSMGT